MEASLLLIISLACLVITIFLVHIKHLNASSKDLPPGPWKLPIIGSMHHLLGEHPHRRLRSLAKTYGPLLHLKLGEINLIVVSSPELTCEVMKTQDVKFASRPELLVSKIISYDNSGMAFAPLGKYWLQLRKICLVNLLSPKRIKSFSSIREEEGHKLVQKLRKAEGSPVNITEMFKSVAYSTVARAAFGKECAHQHKFLMATEEIFKLTSGFSIVDLFPSVSFLGEITGLRPHMERLHRTLDSILNEIIEEHQMKASKCDINGDGSMDEDIVDALLKLTKDEELDVPLRMDNIKAVILDLFLAGTETTSTTLNWIMTELIRHPEVMRRAQLEVRTAFHGKEKVEEEDIINLHYLNQIIKEGLRFHPPGPLLVPRHVSNTVELSGYTIPSGSRVVINAWAIMRDPSYWDDPESFRPERFNDVNPKDFKGANFEYIPFGGGRRICPGITFAMSSIEHVLALLLFHFDWKLPVKGMSPVEFDVEEEFGLSLTKKNDLQLLATES
ncbi:Premnaspirodiene oxygenase [Apostasia shenzhenica]|uniref:Premnaspirodiene oxygenase n=1 Tax=Apostasia shenzhenica TaxID=1088818 RepID=A0A2I0AA38_9ASPA|nr:Premnaspirodiene oxygenase [Apostasia shenzhenica]